MPKARGTEGTTHRGVSWAVGGCRRDLPHPDVPTPEGCAHAHADHKGEQGNRFECRRGHPCIIVDDGFGLVWLTLDRPRRAPLLAAAPELYAALEAAEPYIIQATGGLCGPSLTLRDQIRAALLKANPNRRPTDGQ